MTIQHATDIAALVGTFIAGAFTAWTLIPRRTMDDRHNEGALERARLWEDIDYLSDDEGCIVSIHPTQGEYPNEYCKLDVTHPHGVRETVTYERRLISDCLEAAIEDLDR